MRRSDVLIEEELCVLQEAAGVSDPAAAEAAVQNVQSTASEHAREEVSGSGNHVLLFTCVKCVLLRFTFYCPVWPLR